MDSDALPAGVCARTWGPVTSPSSSVLLSTIIDGYVNGGYGPDLAPLLMSTFSGSSPGDLSKTQGSSGPMRSARRRIPTVLTALLHAGSGLEVGDIVLPGFFPTLEQLQGVLSVISEPYDLVVVCLVGSLTISLFLVYLV